MKISPINAYNHRTNNVSFKQSAVPYPEYGYSYNIEEDTFGNKVSNLINKLAELFSPKVTKEAENIKSGIDNLYSKQPDDVKTKKQAHQKLVSILA